jgi:sulfonate transport system substrate-binding protein
MSNSGISVFTGLRRILRQIWRHRAVSLLFALGLGLSLVVASCSPATDSGDSTASPSAPAESRVVRIGHQKFDPFTLVKARGGLEKRLQELNATVEWTEFQAGPPMLEALNVGSIDVARTGDAPPVFAQAADAPLVYVGGSAPKDRSSALLVPADSPVQSVEDLRGKKVAYTQGSSANYLLAVILEESGLQWSDVEAVNLTPADARAAFEQKNIDGWVIWDPFYAAAQEQVDARVIRDSEGLAANRDFYLATNSFAAENADVIEAIAAETQSVAEWAEANPDEVVGILSPILGIDAPILDVVNARRNYSFEPINDEMVAEQQKIADTFFELRLIPKQVKVQDVIWQESPA